MWSRVSLAWSRLMLRWARRRWPRMPLWTASLSATWSRRTVLNVAGSVLATAVAVGALLVALLSSKGSTHHTATTAGPLPSDVHSNYVPPSIGPTLTDVEITVPTSTAASSSASGTGVSSSGVSSSGSSSAPVPSATLSELDARQAVIAYLNAVNARNKVQAAALICQSLQPTWLQNVDTPNSDFNYTVTSATFASSTALGGGTVFVHYTLVFNDNTTNDVDFTVIEENGPKICGEQRA